MRSLRVPRQHARLAVIGAAGALAARVLGGCSQGEPSPPDASADASPFDSRQLVGQAEAAGASREQLDVLKGGQVTFEQYQEAVTRTLSCIRDAGIEVLGDSVTETDGFPEIPYAFGATSPGRTSDQTVAIADECIATHSEYVELSYASSPASVEAREAAFAPYRAAVLTCLADNGGDVSDDATRGSIISAAVQVQNDSGVDCLTKAGYDG